MRWNIVKCGTPDALYRSQLRVLDGEITRLAITSMPDNTFAPFKPLKPRSQQSEENIIRYSSLIQLMQGEVGLKVLEQVGLDWLERIRLESLRNDDEVMASQRMRIPITAERICCALMLAQYARWLVAQLDERKGELPKWAGGCTTAEDYLKAHPNVLGEHLTKFQTAGWCTMMDCLCDYLHEQVLLYFRSRLERARASEDHVVQSSCRRSNDSIYDQLPQEFTDADLIKSKDGNKEAQLLPIISSEPSSRNKVYEWMMADLQKQILEGTIGNMARFPSGWEKHVKQSLGDGVGRAFWHLLNASMAEGVVPRLLAKIHNQKSPYELLRESNLTVVGEHKLHITHSICCLPEDDWDTITEVHSHPVALMQCRQFLAQHPQLKNVEAEDTAGSAKMIAEGQHRGWAAICHAEAARLYGLKVLEDHIEDNKHNFTRFLVVSNPNKADMLRPLTETNKSSIVFSLPHEEGSLSHVLAILSFYKINLTKIQSLPIIGREWEYLFYVDVMYDDLTRYRQSIDAIIPLTKDLKILGEYKDGKQTN